MVPDGAYYVKFYDRTRTSARLGDAVPFDGAYDWPWCRWTPIAVLRAPQPAHQ